MDSEVKQTLSSFSAPFPAVPPWASYFTPLSFSFSVCTIPIKMPVTVRIRSGTCATLGFFLFWSFKVGSFIILSLHGQEGVNRTTILLQCLEQSQSLLNGKDPSSFCFVRSGASNCC